MLVLAAAGLLPASADPAPGPRGASVVRSGRADAGEAAVTAPGLRSHPPRLTAAQRLRLMRGSDQERTAPETPEDPTASLSAAAPQAASTRVPPTGDTASPRLPGDFMLSHATDLGASKAALVAEPSVARWNNLVLETWNWNAGVSTDGGSTFSYINPKRKFPSKWGGFCCDQVVYYAPSRGIFVWAMMYNEDSKGNNGIRLAVTDAAGLATGVFWYWDITPKQLGLKSGINFDQPDIAGSDNFLYMEVAEFNANKGDRYNKRSDVLRFDLDDLAAKALLPYYVYSTPLFGPGMTSGAHATMYFAAHVDNDTLRVFSWPESVLPSGVTSVDVDHSA